MIHQTRVCSIFSLQERYVHNIGYAVRQADRTWTVMWLLIYIDVHSKYISLNWQIKPLVRNFLSTPKCDSHQFYNNIQMFMHISMRICVSFINCLNAWNVKNEYQSKLCHTLSYLTIRIYSQQSKYCLCESNEDIPFRIYVFHFRYGDIYLLSPSSIHCNLTNCNKTLINRSFKRLLISMLMFSVTSTG